MVVSSVDEHKRRRQAVMKSDGVSPSVWLDARFIMDGDDVIGSSGGD